MTEHGTALRYEEGCRCLSCVLAEARADDARRAAGIRRGQAAGARTRRMAGNGYSAITTPLRLFETRPDYDARDRVTLGLVELLEARIDQRPWRARASCAGQPISMFFPPRGDHKSIAEAKAVCATCPVTAECLAAAKGERAGIFGGLTGRERQVLRQETA